MFFANVAGGFYLVCGGAPGTRQDNGGGSLVALRLDPVRLFDFDGSGTNGYLRDRLTPQPASDSAGSDEAQAMIAPSLTELGAAGDAALPTIVTDLAAPPGIKARMLTFEEERAFQIEYAWRPYPLSEIRVTRTADGAIVDRRIARGPLAATGAIERWSRDASGRWKFLKTVSRWKI
jgi:hypothetical protein